MDVADLPASTPRKRNVDGAVMRLTRTLPAVAVVFAVEERATLAHNRLLAQKFFFDVDGTGSNSFATASDRFQSASEADRGSIVVQLPDESADNDFVPASDPADNVVVTFTAFQQACRDKGVDVPSTVGRALTAMTLLVREPARDSNEIARLERELKVAVDGREAAEKALALRTSALEQTTADVVSIERASDQAKASLAAVQADLTEAKEDYVELTNSMDPLREEFRQVEDERAVFRLALEESTKETIIASDRESHRFQTLSAVDEALANEQQSHFAFRRELEKITEMVGSAVTRDESRLQGVRAVVSSNPTRDPPVERVQSSATARLNRLVAAAKSKHADSKIPENSTEI